METITESEFLDLNTPDPVSTKVDTTTEMTSPLTDSSPLTGSHTAADSTDALVVPSDVDTGKVLFHFV